VDPTLNGDESAAALVKKEKDVAVLGSGGNFACRRCPKSFRRPDYLADHERTAHNITSAADSSGPHRSSNSKPFSCAECKKSFTSEVNLKRHIEGHHAAPGRSFRCPAASCKKSYPERSSLMRHIRTHLRAGKGDAGTGHSGGGGRLFGDSSGDSDLEEGETGQRRGQKKADPIAAAGPPFTVKYLYSR
jgi:Zinc finger, C2H2 type/Zinc-finger of C2H2 type